MIWDKAKWGVMLALVLVAQGCASSLEGTRQETMLKDACVFASQACKTEFGGLSMRYEVSKGKADGKYVVSGEAVFRRDDLGVVYEKVDRLLVTFVFLAGPVVAKEKVVTIPVRNFDVPRRFQFRFSTDENIAYTRVISYRSSVTE